MQFSCAVYNLRAMTLEQVILLLGVMVAPIPPLLVAAAWLHGSLSRLTTRLEVHITKQENQAARIDRLESRLERLERRCAGDQT